MSEERPTSATCEWCGDEFDVPATMGPVPRFCKASHRQRAFEKRRLDAVAPSELEFVGWLCPCHRRVVRPNPDGSKPDHHLISKDEGTFRCNISPELWQRTFVAIG